MLKTAEVSDVPSVDDMYCYYVYIFQKELGITIDGKYPVARFQILLEEAIKDGKKK